jgi:N-acetylglucosaminyl-diphospho-decaprenol L-rhamnosyltransferase
MELLVVITSYRATDLTIDCLHSLKDEIAQIPTAKVAICDNGNEDDTLERLNKAVDDNGWHDWVYLRTVTPNRGFSGGNNIILREALQSSEVPDYFLLLNADTIVHSGAITGLLAEAKKQSDVGIFCPRLEWPSGEGQISCFRYMSPLSEMLAAARFGPLSKLFASWEVPKQVVDTPELIDWGSFACALIKKEVFFDIGVLDEGYYLYYDDIDYCRSANNAGWKVLYWPVSRVVHLRGKSNPVKEKTAQRKRRPEYWYNSRSWYFCKFYGRIGLFAANILWVVGRTISLLREVVGHKESHLCDKEEVDIWKGFWQKVKPRTEIDEG